MDTAYFYAPYIPIYTTPTINLNFNISRSLFPYRPEGGHRRGRRKFTSDSTMRLQMHHIDVIGLGNMVKVDGHWVVNELKVGPDQAEPVFVVDLLYRRDLDRDEHSYGGTVAVKNLTYYWWLYKIRTGNWDPPITIIDHQIYKLNQYDKGQIEIAVNGWVAEHLSDSRVDLL